MSNQNSDEPTPPVIRHAPLGELRVYTVYEHELDSFARGSPASLCLNFALTLLPISLTLIVTLCTTTIHSDRLFTVFVCVCTITLIGGIVLLAMWLKQHKNSRTVIEQIKNRMPPPEAIQEIDPL